MTKKFFWQNDSKRLEGTESCNYLGFVQKRLFRIKISHGSKRKKTPQTKEKNRYSEEGID